MNVSPGATFEAVVEGFATGIGSAGTAALGVRIRDGAGANFLARTTASIVEDVTVGANAVYRRSFTAPADAGQYWLVWDNGTATRTEELLVTHSLPAAPGTDNLYVTADEIKSAADILGETFADTQIDTVIPAVCQAINLYKKTIFYPSDTQTRYYTAKRGASSVPIHDLNDLEELAIDVAGDYSYSDIWTVGTEVFLEPANAAADGYPYRGLSVVRRWASFPVHERAVRVTGSFGWAATPPVVKLAAEKLCVRELAALKTAPMGLIIATEVAARIGSMYRDIADLLDNLPPRPKTGTIQLG